MFKNYNKNNLGFPIFILPSKFFVQLQDFIVTAIYSSALYLKTCTAIITQTAVSSLQLYEWLM